MKAFSSAEWQTTAFFQGFQYCIGRGGGGGGNFLACVSRYSFHMRRLSMPNFSSFWVTSKVIHTHTLLCTDTFNKYITSQSIIIINLGLVVIWTVWLGIHCIPSLLWVNQLEHPAYNSHDKFGIQNKSILQIAFIKVDICLKEEMGEGENNKYNGIKHT